MFCPFLKKNVKNSEEETSKTSKTRQTPSCAVVFCMTFVATIFFIIGVFQTFLAIYYVRESSRRSILALGPLFIGIGLMLYIGLAEICLVRYRRRKRVTDAKETPVSDILAEEHKPAYAGQPRSMMISQLQTHQLPAFLTLTKEDLVKMGPEQKEHLLGGPLLMPPVADKSTTLVPLTFRGHLPSQKVPPVAVYSPPPPEEGGLEEPKMKEDEEKTEDGEDTDLSRKILQVNSETAVEIVNSRCKMTEDANGVEDKESDDPEVTVTEELLTTDEKPIKEDSRMPEEIFQMLEKLEDDNKTSSETPLSPKNLE